MTAQDVAVRSIIDQAIINQHEGMLQSDIIAAALADVPRLMSAIGARREESGFDTVEERWITQWQEVDDV